MKLLLSLLLFFSFFKESFAQDSLYANEIDKIVFSIEDRIKQPNPKLFTVNVFFNDWHEQYIIDTLSRNLLRVKFYKGGIDTLPIHHAFEEPFFTIDTFFQSISFYYTDNSLIKIFDCIYQDSYYPKDGSFLAKTKQGWKTDYLDPVLKMYSILSNRFTRKYKELFGSETRFKINY